MPILTTLLLTAQALAPHPLSSHVCVATTVVAPGERPRHRTRTFSAAETLSVELRTRIRPVVTGGHVLRLKLYTPRGYLYQTFTVPFHGRAPRPRPRWRFGSDDADGQAETRDVTRVVPGFPRPLPVQTLGTRSSRRSTSLDQVTARLPVAGTSISLGSLFGRWTVVPYLDDGTAPCGPQLVFDISE